MTLCHILPEWRGWVNMMNPCGAFNSKSCLFIYVKYIWFGWVLRHINPSGIFDTKSCFHEYSMNIKFGFVGFYVLSTLGGYLMSNHVYTYTFALEANTLLVTSFLKELFELICWLVSIILIKYLWFYLKLFICLHSVKWFQVLLFNFSNFLSIQAIYGKLHGFRLIIMIILNKWLTCSIWPIGETLIYYTTTRIKVELRVMVC